jgi:hypothetical protein
VQEQPEVTKFSGGEPPGYFSGDALLDTCIIHVNIQGLRSHLAELCSVVRLSTIRVDIICVNETFLDEGAGNIELEGFIIVGRRDRNYGNDDRKCGGVLVYARVDIADHVTLLHKSEASERLWLQMHTRNGPYLLCVHGTVRLAKER